MRSYIGKIRLSFLVLFFFSFCFNISAQSIPNQNSKSSVTKIENISLPNKDSLRLGDFVKVSVSNLNNFIAKPPKENAKPIIFINDIPLIGIHPLSIDTVNGFMIFQVNRDTSSKKAWDFFYKYPRNYERKITISVGYENSFVLPSSAKQLTFLMLRKLFYYLSFVSILIILVILILLAKKSNIIRDQSTQPVKPFSLARSQLAFWSVLIIFSFMFIWAVTGNLPAVSGTTLTLLAISIATTTGAKVIDYSQAGFARHQDSASRGFFLDVLSDDKGVNIHRFQMVVWTLILGVFFVRNVILNLDMPQFDENLLILMGISNGTYVGLKIPENGNNQNK